MNIIIEVNDELSHQMIEKYVNVYRSMVLTDEKNSNDSTIYISDSIKNYHKYHNTIVVGFEIQGFRNVVDIKDGAVFFQVFHSIIKESVSLNDTVHVNAETLVRVDSIVSVESFNRKSIVKMLKQEYPSDLNYKQWYERLRYRNFIEVHRGILINIDYIDMIHNDVIHMKNATTVPVSRRKRTSIKHILKLFQIKIQD